MKPKNKKSFTLVELLITIALIGILAGIGIITHGEAQKKARDAQRKNDLQAVVKAMYLAKADCKNGAYVPAGGPYGAYRHYTSMVEYLKYNGYIETIPSDPKGPAYVEGFDPGTSYDNLPYIYRYFDSLGTHTNFCALHPLYPGVTPGWYSGLQGSVILVTRLERAGKDPDTKISRDKCPGAIDVNDPRVGIQYYKTKLIIILFVCKQ